jgi:hypothetical protein
MSTKAFAVALATTLALTSAAYAGGVPIVWKGKPLDAAALPNDLPSPAAKAIATWSPWAEKAGYRFDLDAQARVMLVSSAKRSNATDTLKIVGRVESWFDSMLPPPARSASAPKTDAPTPAGARPASSNPIPEDPEEAPAAAPPKRETARPSTPTRTWGSGSVAPDSLTAVLVVVDGESDYRGLVERVSSMQTYLAAWATKAYKQTGFTLEEPLVGAFTVGASGQEEWNFDHEVANRTVQLLTLRRFGQQPNWIVQGIAWAAEMALDDTVYCFPYRDEFVYTAEHGSWPTDVRALFKDRANKPLEIGELASWERGTWDGVAAKTAWGVAEYLLDQRGKMSAALEELRQIRDRDNRRATGATTWERIPDWEVPAEKQLATLEKQFGVGVLKAATQAFTQLGKAKEKTSSTRETRAKSKDSSKR